MKKCSDLPITKVLINRGWKLAEENQWRMSKDEWIVVFDTSNWIEVGSINSSRIFDVPVPSEGLEVWTANLIEHLCRTDDLLEK
jgi:hypothetical protein